MPPPEPSARASPPAAARRLGASAPRAPGRPCLLRFSLAAVGAGAGRALTTTYLPVLLERIDDAPPLIGAVMTVNAIAGFAVPIAVGIWSDRRGRRLPFIAGGAVLTAGGLVAVGLGNGTSYLALALAAALVYTGLNALTTAHRAIVAEDVEDERRPAATSAQEIAGLVGAVVAVAIGGALIEPAPAAAFALAAGVLALTAVPTMLVTRRLGLGERVGPRAGETAPAACARRAAPSGRARGPPRPDPVGLRLRRAARLLRALRRGQPRPGRRRRRRASARLRRAHRARHGGRGPCPARARARAPGDRRRAARRRPAGRRAGDEPRRRRPGLRRRGARRGPRHRARLPLLRPLRARGRGRPLQRRLLRRARGGLRGRRCRWPAWPSS